MLNSAEVDVKWSLDNITCYYYKTTKAINAMQDNKTLTVMEIIV